MASASTARTETSGAKPNKVCFVTNFNTFYRKGVFDRIARILPTFFIFFSKGSESYWLREHGVERTEASHVYLSGFEIAGTRITPSLFWYLLRDRYDVYLKCINGRFALPATYAVARLRRRPFVLWTEVWMQYRTRAHQVFYPITRHIYRQADAVVACGEHVAAFLRNEGVDPSRIFVARHAVDNDAYARPANPDTLSELRNRLGIREGQKTVLYLGRLVEVKGLSYLLEGFAKANCGDAVILIAGIGPEQTALQQLAAKLGIEHKVKFAGYVPPAATIDYYALATVLVLPSIELPYIKETWGLVVNEAFCQGVPVIATDAVGAAAGGLVADRVTGLVCRERDSLGLARAIETLLNDPALRERMSKACRAEIGNWTQERMAGAFVAAMEYACRR